MKKKKTELAIFCAIFFQIKLCINKNCIFGKIRQKDKSTWNTLLKLLYLLTIIYMLKERKNYFQWFWQIFCKNKTFKFCTCLEWTWRENWLSPVIQATVLGRLELWDGMKSNGLYIPPRGKDYLAVLGHPLHGKCVNRGD